MKLIDYIINRSLDTPKKLFCHIEGVEYDYYTFNQHIESIQQSIRSLDLSSNKIFLNFDKKINLLCGIIACNREKKIPIISPDKYDQIENMNYSSIAKSGSELNETNCIVQLKREIYNKEYIYNPNDIQCIMFTSGSEGPPMPVELSFDNIFYSAKSWNEILNFSMDEVYLNILPTSHISGLSIFFRSIYFNFTVYYFKYSNNRILNYLQLVRPQYLSIVPKIADDLMRNKKSAAILKSLKTLIVGGDAIDETYFSYCMSYKIKSYISYGMTETASGIAGYFINGEKKFNLNYIGFPHKYVKINLNKDERIQIQSKMVAVNFRDSNNILIANDYGEIKNSKLFFKSRADNVIISGGKNINIKLIENVLSDFDFNLIVTGYNDPKWGRVPIVIYEKNSRNNINNELKIFCHRNLPKFMVPKYFIEIIQLPYLPNQKLDLGQINHIIKNAIS